MINFASRAEYRSRIEKVVVYINEHLGEPLDMATLAMVSKFSPLHFPRIFQAAMNETPEAYVERQRVERAARTMMAAGNTPVTDVATACGFSSHISLDQAFKSHYGVSTSEYSRGRNLQSLAESCGIQANTMASGEKRVWDCKVEEIDGQTCAVFKVECRAEEVEAEYLSIYRDWLPDSGFEPENVPCYEHGVGNYTKDIYIRVKPILPKLVAGHLNKLA